MMTASGRDEIEELLEYERWRLSDLIKFYDEIGSQIMKSQDRIRTIRLKLERLTATDVCFEKQHCKPKIN